MIKTVLTLAFASATGIGGYLGGSVYPAPPVVVNAINAQANDLRTKLKLEQVDLAGLQGLVSKDKFEQFSGQIQSMAAAAGEVIVVDRENSTREEQLDNLALSEADLAAATGTASPLPAPAAAPAPAAPGGAKPATPAPTATKGQVFNTALSLCPKMTIENAPAADAAGKVTTYKPVVLINNVKVATDPTRTGCLSSGYGTRNARLHKGLDYHNEAGGPIISAGDGTIVEMKYRDDYGNMLLIDHGGGVYTRYAHLASFGAGLSTGVKVFAGEQIGLMGNTASYPVPIHLHYEVLLGDYKNPKASFGLKPADPMTYPAAT